MSVSDTAHDVVAVARHAQVSMLAAGLAYFGFASLLPFTLLVVIAMTTLGGEELAEQFFTVAISILGEQFGTLLTEAAFAGGPRHLTAFVSVIVLAWSWVRLFQSSESAFAAVYGERKQQSLRATFRDAVLVFATNVVAMMLLVGISILYGLTQGTVATLAPIVLFVVLTVVFFPMFYVLPEADVTLEEVLPGTVFAAGAWATASVLFGVYAGFASAVSYGAAGAAILVLTWLYVGGLALLFGATLNAVMGGRVDPEDVWVPTDYM